MLKSAIIAGAVLAMLIVIGYVATSQDVSKLEARSPEGPSSTEGTTEEAPATESAESASDGNG